MRRAFADWVFIFSILVVMVVLTGCATTTPTKVVDVAPRCKQTPSGLAELKEGDNLIDKHAEVRREYATVASRLRCTQRYISAVRK
jgi:hypothetical protein